MDEANFSKSTLYDGISAKARGAFFRASLSLSGLPGMELICLVKPEPSRELVTEQLFCPDDSGDSVGPAAKNRQLLIIIGTNAACY